MTYKELVKRLGEPETERLYLGLSAARIDRWPCGCYRTYAAPSGDETYVACERHVTREETTA